jgi:hypothetical protein
MSLCPRCGSILDGPRENPKTRRVERKCPDCLGWQSVPDRGPGAAMRRALASSRAGHGGRPGRSAL